MNTDAIDKSLHEKFFGCWHEFIDDHEIFRTSNTKMCAKCQLWFPLGDENPSYLSWSNYGPLLEKLKEHEKWETFIFQIRSMMLMINCMVIPSCGRQAIWEFFCKEK